MKLIHRKIDFIRDRDYVLERHCRINYACDSPWKRRTMTYPAYREEWFSLESQVSGFYHHLQATALDGRTIAEILEIMDGRTAGYLWAPFYLDSVSGFCFAEIQDIYIGKEFRRLGFATELYGYVEEAAKRNGAQVVRAGTGCENTGSIALHKMLGFYPYRYEFEKLL